MTKQEFLKALQKNLSAMPALERDKSIKFYDEMLSDRIEDGMDEAMAVADMGDPQTIAQEIMREIKLKKKGGRSVWRTVLLALGSPLWIALLCIPFSVVLALLITACALVLSLFAVVIALAASAVLVCLASILLLVHNPPGAVLQFGVGLFCGGLASLAGYGTWQATKALGRLWTRMAGALRAAWNRRRGIEQ